jgi:Family of unknown function (DUF6335)
VAQGLLSVSGVCLKKENATTKTSEPPPVEGRESERFDPSAEVREEFEEAAQQGSGGPRQLAEKLRQNAPAASPELSGGDVDAAWETESGEEAVGGDSPTPDQGIVDELGEALGVVYQEGEPLHTTEKLEERDEHRWELDPASSEGFGGRSRHEGKYEEK